MANKVVAWGILVVGVPILLGLTAAPARAAERPAGTQWRVAQAAGASQVEDAEARAAAIIQAAEEEAARIRSEALKRAAEIEAEAVRRAAEIEAEAIRKAARHAPRPSAKPGAQTPADPGVQVSGDRYPSIAGMWSWKGNARNRKFEIEQQADGTVATELFTSVRTRHYREDLRYEDGKLQGRTYQILETTSGRPTKRFRDFALEISADGNRLEGTITQWDEKNNRKDEDEVVWERIGN